MAVTVIELFKGRDNAPVLNFAINGESLPFITMGVTKLAVMVEDVEYSSTDGYLSYDDLGNVTFKLANLPTFPDDPEPIRVIAYDASHPRGKVIVSELSPNLLVPTFN